MKFTPQQIMNWRAYELVRRGGRFNMFDPNARVVSGLSKEDYGFVMSNYEALADVAQAK